MPTPIFLTGFEHGLLSATGTALFGAVTGTPAIQSSAPVRTGTYALEISAALNTAEHVAAANIGAGRRVIVERFYVRFPTSLPSDNETICLFVNANGSATLLFNQASSRITGTIGGVSGNTAAVTLVADQWYRIDVRFAVGTARSGGSSGTSYLDFSVDGTTATQQTRAQTDADITSVLIGTTSTSHAATTWRVDDWYVSATDADYPIGAGEIQAQTPDADGTSSFTAGNFKDAAGVNISGSNAAWDNLNVLPFGQTSTYVAQPTAAAAEYVEVTTGPRLSISSVLGVRAVCALFADGTNAFTADSRVTENGTSRGSTGAIDFSDTTLTYRGFLVTGFTDVLDLDWRIGFGQSQPAAPRWAGLVIEVDYAPNRAEPGLIDSTGATFTPTITSNYNLALGLVDSTGATFAPTFAQASPQTVTIGALIDSTGATFAPQVNLSAAPGLIDSTGTTFSPQVNESVAVGLITQTGTTFSPQVNEQVVAGLISSPGATFTPTVIPAQFVTPGLITSTGTPFAMVVTAGVFPDLITSTGTPFSPNVAVNQAFGVGLITSTGTPFSPTVIPAQFVTAGLISSPGTVLAPQVNQAFGVGLITSTGTPFSPSVALSVGVGLVTSTGSPFAPTVVPGNVNVIVGLIDSTGQAIQPTQIGGKFVEAALLAYVGTPLEPVIIRWAPARVDMPEGLEDDWEAAGVGEDWSVGRVSSGWGSGS